MFWAIAFKKIKLAEHQIPLMGLLTAFFFAAMMINIPLIGPTTAHLLGGAVIGLLLGPFAGLLSMSIILVMQAFLFGDGGLIVLGANVLNIGIIGVFIPCIIFIVLNKLFKPKIGPSFYATIFLSAFFGDLLAAIAAGIEVGLSPLSTWYGLSVAVPAMALNHAIIGIAEGFVTVFLIMALINLRPDVAEKSPILNKLAIFKNKTVNDKTPLPTSKKLNKKTILTGLTAALICVIIGVFCFSNSLEMLDLKAGELGLTDKPIFDPLFPDYSLTWLEGPWGDLIIGVVFTLLLFIIALLFAKLIIKTKNSQKRIPRSLRDLVNGAETLIYIEDLSEKKGLMQAIHPIAKLVTIGFMIFSALFIHRLSYLLIICIVPIALTLFSRIPLRQLFTRTLFIPLLMALISIPTLFLTAGDPLWTANIGNITIAITIQGITRLLTFTLRIWFCIASLSLLILSTGFDKTLKLFATLHVPSLIIQLFSLTYRYFFVSIHEAQSILIAKEARTYINRQILNLQALKDIGTMLSSLFIRTYERSERVYLAMKARGFDINKNNKLAIPPLHAKDIVFTTLIIAAFVYLVLL
ncbi:MAG: cobalt ECF transporter T component CbiQ [Candidatus Bathyarchaeota archaeon]|nr:cobalt ECF transporter T component CbiQ [Candidatus Termiticorpusculum sp.]MCL2257768.1 cobalt ECF transporter T component CbiQ [Candidatus Termiticorpusculum sp.]MCL2292095.1 cobalt ECF transporter T component CbiQ [Candidatus Termiticorpusculum sp.]